MLVTDRVHRLGGLWGTGVGGANIYLLVDSGLTVVDTGFRGRAGQILRAAKRLGCAPSDIKRIIITHHHADHVGSLAALKKATGASVAAHPADAPYIDGTLPQPGPSRPAWLSRTLAPLPIPWGAAAAAVDTLIDEGDELPVLGGIRVLHTPGHTAGSICLLLKELGLVIVGDLMTHRLWLSLPSRMFTVDMAREVQSIRRLGGEDFDAVCFGHGRPLLRDARPAVARFAEALERRFGAT